MVWLLPLCRFTRPPPAELSSGVCRSNCNVGPFTRTPSSYSGGPSNDIVLRKPDVFHAPKMNPTSTHTDPVFFPALLTSRKINPQFLIPTTPHTTDQPPVLL